MTRQLTFTNINILNIKLIEILYQCEFHYIILHNWHKWPKMAKTLIKLEYNWHKGPQMTQMTKTENIKKDYD